MGLDDENKCYRLGKDVRSLVNVENEVVLLSKSFSLFDLIIYSPSLILE